MQQLSARHAALELFVSRPGERILSCLARPWIWGQQANGLANLDKVRTMELLPSYSTMSTGLVSAPWSKSSACARPG